MRGGKKYPVKTTVNLAQKERKHRDLGAVILTAVVLAVAIALFCKFGVIDRLNKVGAAQAQAAAQTAQLAQLREQTADYPQVLEEYQDDTLSVSAAGGGADPMDCLRLMEDALLSKSEVSSFTVSSDQITVKLSGVTLNEVSGIYLSLTASDLVKGVQVYTAATDSEKKAAVTATMTITLAVEEPAAADAGGGGEASS